MKRLQLLFFLLMGAAWCQAHEAHEASEGGASEDNTQTAKAPLPHDQVAELVKQLGAKDLPTLLTKAMKDEEAYTSLSQEEQQQLCYGALRVVVGWFDSPHDVTLHTFLQEETILESARIHHTDVLLVMERAPLIMHLVGELCEMGGLEELATEVRAFSDEFALSMGRLARFFTSEMVDEGEMPHHMIPRQQLLDGAGDTADAVGHQLVSFVRNIDLREDVSEE